MSKPIVRDVVATRYASISMVDIWSGDRKVISERQFWLAILFMQEKYGVVKLPEGVRQAYEAVVENVDQASINVREKALKHDVMARIEEFNSLATAAFTGTLPAGTSRLGYIHLGMTSRDLTESIEQCQILGAAKLVRDRVVTTMALMSKRAIQDQATMVVGRSHNVAAQATTLGKRLTNLLEPLFEHFLKLEHWIQTYPVRGVKGPVGTSQDMLDRFGNDKAKLGKFEADVASYLGFGHTMISVGQTYPRSYDAEIGNILKRLASVASNFGIMLRLMAGDELATEGFTAGQVGSSAMPHKMNTRSSERINGLNTVLRGYVHMLEDLEGDLWLEGDVRCSVPRRVALPGMFYAMDGLLETMLTVLDDFGLFPGMIEREIERFLPFLATTRILTAATENGKGREAAHEAIKDHAVATALGMREGADNTLFELLAADERLGLSIDDIHELTSNPGTYIGNATDQVNEVVARVNQYVVPRYHDALDYRPAAIL